MLWLIATYDVFEFCETTERAWVGGRLIATYDVFEYNIIIPHFSSDFRLIATYDVFELYKDKK